jgi:hypothetical protein
MGLEIQAKFQRLAEDLQEEKELDEPPSQEEVVDLVVEDLAEGLQEDLDLDLLPSRDEVFDLLDDAVMDAKVRESVDKLIKKRLNQDWDVDSIKFLFENEIEAVPQGELFNPEEPDLPEIEEKVEEEVEEEEMEGDGRPFHKKRMRKVRLPHRLMDYRDGRNDVFKMRKMLGQGAFTNADKRLAKIFS